VDNKQRQDQEKHACHGHLNLHINTVVLLKRTQKLDWFKITAETLMVKTQYGAILLIKVKGGNIVTHLIKRIKLRRQRKLRRLRKVMLLQN